MKRGYGRPWEIRRARILQRDKYLCQNCRRHGIATKATSVDHIIPKARGGTDDDSIWSRCAGPAIERKQQQREPDEEFQN
jgi:5-methylcytosine-specific restriction protein A